MHGAKLNMICIAALGQANPTIYRPTQVEPPLDLFLTNCHDSFGKRTPFSLFLLMHSTPGLIAISSTPGSSRSLRGVRCEIHVLARRQTRRTDKQTRQIDVSFGKKKKKKGACATIEVPLFWLKKFRHIHATINTITGDACYDRRIKVYRFSANTYFSE